MGKIYCINCGAENDDDLEFCTTCGAKLDRSFLGEETSEIDRTQIYEEESFDNSRKKRRANKKPKVRTSDDGDPAGWSEPPKPRRRTGAVVAITLGVAVAVLAVAFGLFYFLNPLGLTTGIFSESAAAYEQIASESQEAAKASQEQTKDAQQAAEEAQGQAQDAQAQLEEIKQQNEELQKQADEAQKQAEAAQQQSQTSSNANGSTSTMASITVTGEDGTTRTATAPLVGDTERVIPDSNTRPLTQSEVDSMTDGERYIAWKEIIAAETGYMFLNKGLSQYFTSRSWYVPNPDGNGYCDPGVAADNVNKLKESLDDTWWLHVTYP